MTLCNLDRLLMNYIRRNVISTTIRQVSDLYQKNAGNRGSCRVKATDSSIGQRREFVPALLPMLTIEWRQSNRRDGAHIQAAAVHAYAFRMRSRNIERLHATMAAEIMLGNAGIEFVSG